MAMPPSLSEADQQRIRDLHAEGLSRNAIAREIGRGQRTVTRAAEAMGLQFTRIRTIVATEAKVIDARARRAALTHRLLDEAELLLDRLQNPYTVWKIGNDGELHRGQLELPDARDQRDLMLGAATAIEKSLRLEQFDSDPGINGAKSMLGALAAGLGHAYQELVEQQPGDD
jgi:plasmid maintenance system antidote protein VapI